MINLTSLHLYGISISSNGFQALTNLSSLILFYTGNITDNGIKKLTSLTKFQYRGMSTFGDDGIKELVNLIYLDILVTDKSMISNEGLKNLTNLKRLYFPATG